MNNDNEYIKKYELIKKLYDEHKSDKVAYNLKHLNQKNKNFVIKIVENSDLTGFEDSIDYKRRFFNAKCISEDVIVYKLDISVINIILYKLNLIPISTSYIV